MWAIIFGVVLVGGSVTAFLTMGQNNTPQNQEDPEQFKCASATDRTERISAGDH